MSENLLNIRDVEHPSDCLVESFVGLLEIHGIEDLAEKAKNGRFVVVTPNLCLQRSRGRLRTTKKLI